MGDIERRVAAIREDLEHGATFLAMEAVRTLGDAALAWEGRSDWRDCLSLIAKRLAGAKPAMGAVGNATDRLLIKLLELGPVEAHRALSLVEELLSRMESDAEDVACKAAGLISLGATVMTCSRSSSVLRTLQRSHEAGRTPRVIVLDFGTGHDSPGRRLAGDLERIGIDVEIVSSIAEAGIIERAEIAVVGADAVTRSFVVNGTPTLALARAASGLIPFYVVGESMKFVPEISPAPGYDLVPLELVTGIVCETGIVAPSDVGRIIDTARGR